MDDFDSIYNRVTKQKSLMKNITLAVTIILFSTNYLSAQEKITVDYRVTTSFNNEFKYATLVQWTKLPDNLVMARFDNHQDHCIAYFSPEGKMLLTGRKISFEIIPLAVQKRAEELRTMNEAKGSDLTVREIYELARDHGTEYFINFTSEKLALSVIVYGDGTSKVLRKLTPPFENEGTPTIAAGDY
jgi:hypothetical protein